MMAVFARQSAQHQDEAVHADFTCCSMVSSTWYGALSLVGLMPIYVLMRASGERAILVADEG
jgi:hypothetical protein